MSASVDPQLDLDVVADRASAFVREMVKPGRAGVDGLAFWLLARALRGQVIALREPDLCFWGVEDWAEKCFFATAPVIECVRGEGEIPCLYCVSIPGNASPTEEPPGAFYTLVDFVARTTGSGVGIETRFVKLTLPRSHVQGPDGKRVRYRTRRLAKRTIDQSETSIHWVEHAELGRAPGSTSALPKLLSFLR
jgi:hypothetical protein